MKDTKSKYNYDFYAEIAELYPAKEDLRLFPCYDFYYFDWNRASKKISLRCEFTNVEPEINKNKIMGGYLVFYSKDVVKFCLDIDKIQAIKEIMKVEDQVFGYRTAYYVEREMIEQSEWHELAYHYFIEKNKYKVNAILGKKITVKEMIEFFDFKNHLFFAIRLFKDYSDYKTCSIDLAKNRIRIEEPGAEVSMSLGSFAAIMMELLKENNKQRLQHYLF